MMYLTLIIFVILHFFTANLFSQTGAWERIDTNLANLNVVDKRLFAQFHKYTFSSEIIGSRKYSDDNGKTWTAISYKGKKTYRDAYYPPDLTKIVRHPQYLLTNTTLYGEDLLGSKSIVYRSYTNGATWDTIALPKKISRLFIPIYIDAVTVQESILYLALSQVYSGISGGAGGYGGGFYFSKNHGITWDSVNNYSDNTLKLSEKQLAATATAALAINSYRTILRLPKGGTVWDLSLKKLHDRDTTDYLKRLTSNQNHFFVIGHNYRRNTSTLWRGNSDGTEWKSLIEADDVEGMYVTDKHLLISTNKRGVIYSANNGDTWVSLNDGNASIIMTSVAISSDGWVYGSGLINGVKGIFRRRFSP